jgi:GT2 family glycosyltransferase
MSDANESNPIQSLPFDLYERYVLTRRLLELVWPQPSGPLRVLDVGGHSSPLKHVLPQYWVTLTDIKPPGTLVPMPLRYDSYVQADATRLPFRSGAFDLVTAHDTLEHIPPPSRATFLDELIRVSGGCLILNGPVYDPETVRAERVLARLQRSLGLEENVYLSEHLELGLPPRRLIAEALDRHELKWVALPNGDLRLWLAANAAKSLALATFPSGGLEDVVDRTLNRGASGRISSQTCYREAFVVAVREGMAGSLEHLRDQGALWPEGDGVDLHETLGLLEAFVRETPLSGGRDGRSRREASALDRPHTQDRVTQGVAYRALMRIHGSVDAMAPWGTRRRSLILAPARAARLVMNEGWARFLSLLIRPWRWAPTLWKRAIPPVERLTWDERYELWLRLNVLSPRRLRAMRREERTLAYRPLLSVVMPVFDPDPHWLRAAIESVRHQVYTNWELCITDDGSTNPEVRRVLGSYDGIDQRIRVTYSDRNQGIAAASNTAIAMASGEFVGFLDHDDELKPNALFEVVRLLNQRRDLDYIYSDEDKVELTGQLTSAFFKPDWSPDLLMSVNYVTHLSVYRRELLSGAGGLRSEYDGSQDYDLALRMTEMTQRIGHVPLPLYSWRKVPGSAAASLDFKSYAYAAGRRALADAVARRGHRGEVEQAMVEGRYRVRYELAGNPRVVIIIPTRDRLDLLEDCVESIHRASTYPNYEIMVVDNDSREPETLRYLAAFDGRVLRYPHPFNYARMMNVATREATDADFYLFLNNDTEVIAPDWIEAMVEHGQRPEVAAVGGRLLYPDGRPQHEGIVIGLQGAAARNVDHSGYFGLGETVRNCSAVSAACMLLRPEVFWDLGGLEEGLAVAYNDVDFCLRAREKGYQIVYTPYALLYHDEGSSRGLGGTQNPQDEAFFRRRWDGYRDPYYSPSLDVDNPYELKLEE